MNVQIPPPKVSVEVEQYLDDELLGRCAKDATRQPLDEEGVFLLYALAARVYQIGFTDGALSIAERERGKARRYRSATKGGDQ